MNGRDGLIFDAPAAASTGSARRTRSGASRSARPSSCLQPDPRPASYRQDPVRLAGNRRDRDLPAAAFQEQRLVVRPFGPAPPACGIRPPRPPPVRTSTFTPAWSFSCPSVTTISPGARPSTADIALFGTRDRNWPHLAPCRSRP